MYVRKALMRKAFRKTIENLTRADAMYAICRSLQVSRILKTGTCCTKKNPANSSDNRDNRTVTIETLEQGVKYV